MAQIAVIGGGQAGYSVVAKLRGLGFDGTISLICGEDELPYQRPPLSKKYLLGEYERERLYLRQASFYEENDIRLRCGTPCREIDTAARRLHVGDDEIPYDSLVIATGSEPRVLPASVGGDLRGVHTVRTIADIDRIASEVEDSGQAVVVGGGYIGLEAASALVTKGLPVTIIEMAERILQRVAAAETSNHLRQLHLDHGAAVLEATQLRQLQADADGHVAAAILADGRCIEADLVIVGVGIQPVTDLAQMAGIVIDNGIRTDAACRTSDASVWAAGDCASFPWRGRRIRLESVQNAIDQAEHAAAAILGSEEAYEPTPWFWSDQYSAKLQIAGLGTGYDRIVRRSGSAADSVSYWYFHGSELLAVDAVNDSRSYMIGKRLLESGKSADPAAVADPEINLKSLLK
ncbi:MAG: FAD-dependent oxidoreductase [Rhodobacteraceae bacterium]|nr:FAD-dependent oxidoreductase [Paracoccaceae bacterium]